MFVLFVTMKMVLLLNKRKFLLTLFAKNLTGNVSKKAIMIENMEVVGGTITIISTIKMINVILILVLMILE